MLPHQHALIIKRTRMSNSPDTTAQNILRASAGQNDSQSRTPSGRTAAMTASARVFMVSTAAESRIPGACDDAGLAYDAAGTSRILSQARRRSAWAAGSATGDAANSR